METKNGTFLNMEDFPVMCRLCMTKINGPSFPIGGEETTLLDSFTTLDLKNDDEEFPKNMCEKCQHQVMNIKIFLSDVTRADKVLKEFLYKKRNFIEDEDIETSPVPMGESVKVEEGPYSISSDSNSELLEDLKMDPPSPFEMQPVDSEDFVEPKPKSVSKPKKKIRCIHCTDKFDSMVQLRKHRKHCFGKKVYRCEICTIPFSTKSRLKNHLQSHTTEEPYECVLCGKTFKFIQNCRRHEKIVHKGIKPFKCETCGKVYENMQFYRHEERYIALKYCGTCKGTDVHTTHFK